MVRIFKLTITCSNDLKDTPLALKCKESITKELPYLKMVNIKECGKKPHGGKRK